MSHLLLTVLGAFGGAATAAAAVAWLMKTLITQRLTHALDVSRTKLGREVSIELERLRADLAGVAKDREIRLSAFHERRAKVLSAIYADLSDAEAHNAALALAIERIGLDGQEKRAVAASDSVRRMIETSHRRRLYLPPELADKLDDLAIRLSDPSLSYEMYSRGKATRESVEHALKRWNETRGEFEQVRRDVEREFRALLEVPPASESVAIGNAPETGKPR